MNTRTAHGQAGHINTFKLDHESVITGYGVHDRVIAFHPRGRKMYIRVDHKWNLGEPTHAQILAVARKDQGIKGRWIFDEAKRWPDGSCTDYIFRLLEN